jgi:hypothetical protein
MQNHKLPSAGALAPWPHPASPIRRTGTAKVCVRRAHPYRDSQVLFFGHGLPLDFYRHR